MSREIVIGNGELAVVLDNRMRVRDLFFPHVGLENHIVGHEFKIGVWTNNKFMWVGDNWDIIIQYLPETLVSKCLAKNEELGIEIEVNDAVHNLLSLYLRKISVTNSNDSKRQVRLLLSHDFHIYGVDTGDTALYEPYLHISIPSYITNATATF